MILTVKIMLKYPSSIDLRVLFTADIVCVLVFLTALENYAKIKSSVINSIQ